MSKANGDPRIAARLREEREARSMVVAGLAERFRDVAPDDIRRTFPKLKDVERTIRGHEAGEHEVGPRYRLLWSLALGMPEDELFNPHSSNVDIPPGSSSMGDEDVNRRQLLEKLAVLGATTVFQGQALATIRGAFDASLARHGYEHTVDDWQEIAREYAHAYLINPPHILLPDLAADIIALQDVIGRTPTPEQDKGLLVAGATLAAIMGMTTHSLGFPRESRHWWRSARHFADAAGNPDLQVWVHGYESVDALYQRRPITLVLERAETAIRLADGHASPGALEAMACKAQVLAQLGAANKSRDVLRQARSAFEKLPDGMTSESPSLLTWPEQRLLHTESFVYATIGGKEAERAHAAALTAYSPTRIAALAQIDLHRAATLVRGGYIGDGIDHAGRILETLPTTYHTGYVRVVAGKVLEAVPEKEARRPAVKEYRELIALPSPQRDVSI